ncbi:endonuclease/exonuclease/phosphatase family protein [Gallaecimonas kandeliae]|uniref:endonuclease/exonuclease/phosphatase family protein n=1 Tax=Gallaecimonas kandeliae TaxID=3029055 RepID=UPI00264A3EB7|nr:endonuclease/exonuclease/phosphatase family protein [Gallaecimonas kandeliae]WKE64859.1 endonuclease/exonuclease/phosphatase family protein [Gallaecimonas kandeliae]
MLKPLSLTQHLAHQNARLDGDFGVLCWNTQKLTLDQRFQQRLGLLMHQYPSAMLLLQEAKLPLGQHFNLAGLSYAMAPNMQTLSHQYGVLTAANVAFDDLIPLLSRHRELRFATHKSAMISLHLLGDGQSLLVANVHAVNFVHHKRFLAEMEQLIERLHRHAGPMVVAGDFNVWSPRRKRYLEAFAKAAGLTEAVMEDRHHVKSLFQLPLDFIFYRGLKLEMATAIDTDVVSDHNPIYARFSL